MNSARASRAGCRHAELDDVASAKSLGDRLVEPGTRSTLPRDASAAFSASLAVRPIGQIGVPIAPSHLEVARCAGAPPLGPAAWWKRRGLDHDPAVPAVARRRRWDSSRESLERPRARPASRRAGGEPEPRERGGGAKATRRSLAGRIRARRDAGRNASWTGCCMAVGRYSRRSSRHRIDDEAVRLQDGGEDDRRAPEAGVAVDEDAPSPSASRRPTWSRSRPNAGTSVGTPKSGDREATQVYALAGERFEEPRRAPRDLPVLDQTDDQTNPRLPPGADPRLHLVSGRRLVRVARPPGTQERRPPGKRGCEAEAGGRRAASSGPAGNAWAGQARR